MTTHDAIRRNLAACIDGGLSAEEMREVTDHLSSCKECKVAFAELQRTVGYIRGLSEVEPPPWLAEKIIALAQDKAAPQPTVWQRILFPLHIKLPIEAAALICICLIGYQLARTAGVDRSQSMPASAPKEAAKVAPAPSSSETGKTIKQALSPKVTDAGKPPAIPEPPRSKAEEMRDSLTVPNKSASATAAPARSRQSLDSQPEPKEGVAASPKAENAIPHFELKREQAPSAVFRATPAVRPQYLEVTLRPRDPSSAAKQIEEAVRSIGGAIISTPAGDTNRIEAQIDAQQLAKLLEELYTLGTIQMHPGSAKGTSGRLTIVIMW